MLNFFQHINKHAFKVELRKIGSNLISASLIGGFVSHVADFSHLVLELLLVLAIIGSVCLLFGLYKVEV